MGSLRSFSVVEEAEFSFRWVVISGSIDLNGHGV